MGQIFDSTVVAEIEEAVVISSTVDNAPMDAATDEAAAMNGYTVFIPNFTEPCTLISSTDDRYNDTIQQSLVKDTAIIQQKVDTEQQSINNNFFRNAKWSPDGSCLLTNNADDVVRLFQLPQNVYQDSEHGNSVLPMSPTLGIREGESVYDFAWFPLMNAQDPSTCCFITSVRDHPIQLWDYTGSVRASYRAIDHCERFIGPNVLAFNLDGSKIYGGYENMVEIFDVATGDSTKHPTIPKRKSRKGQKGIISCLDFSTDGLYAAGSYSQSIGIYDQTNNELCLKLTGFEGGATQVQFSKDGLYLYSASRHSNSILCWDIRDSANILFELPRPGKTNQRMQFDVDATGKYLMTGDTEGNTLIYDVTTAATTEDTETKQRLVRSFKAHDDITSCATFNPVYPVIATCSGQRKFRLPCQESDSEEEEEEEEEDMIIDNTLKAWRVNGQYEWFSYDNTTLATEDPQQNA
ncbi:WD domain, G-beta repeat-containing protein [Mucor ambiguus]|uniref:WD domain, G-beta repeat-containing protein n=1 Tax=Mucor ambiguus TaxID=91626 RepID=A0A0C9MM12_9FUNG|nr:WD domain, G-beta repeat-containing protein [Mucor ambiguus]